MLQSSEDALRMLAEGSSLLGPGWTAVETFEDIESDEYETDEEVRRLRLLTRLALR
jgi:hypothetical protein